jgi:hypothetical protein
MKVQERVVSATIAVGVTARIGAAAAEVVNHYPVCGRTREEA